jgi:hypothetical protein
MSLESESSINSSIESESEEDIPEEYDSENSNQNKDEIMNHWSPGNDPLLDRDPFEVTETTVQNSSVLKVEGNSLDSSKSIEKEHQYLLDEVNMADLFYFCRNKSSFDPKMLLECQLHLNNEEKRLILKLFKSFREDQTIVTNNYDHITLDSFERLLRDDFWDESLINWNIGHQVQKTNRPRILVLTSYWSLSSSYSPVFFSKYDNLDMVVMPCHWTSHWGVIGFNFKTNRPFFADSFGTYFPSEEMKLKLRNLLSDMGFQKLHDKISFSRIIIPVQQDSWSCGIWVVKTISTLLKEKTFQWATDSKRVSEFKRRVVRKILGNMTMNSPEKNNEITNKSDKIN